MAQSHVSAAHNQNDAQTTLLLLVSQEENGRI